MSMPPPPGQWPGGPQPGWAPPPGGWGPPPPPQRGNAVKWALVVVGVLLIVTIAVATTVFVMRDESGTSTVAEPSGPPIASADDDGPIEIITLEPTCEGWRNIQRSLATAQSNGWGDRDPTVPASAWTPAQRDQFETVGESMQLNAELAADLARQTPHRVMREMYEQFGAYGRAYADAVPRYEADDDSLGTANVGFSRAISGVCDAIEFSDVLTRSSLVSPAEEPGARPETVAVDTPPRFLTDTPQACVDWIQADNRFESRLQDWSREDPEISAVQWTAEQRSIQDDATNAFNEYADTVYSIGRDGGNPTLEDLSALAALYIRAFASRIPSYVPTDNYIVQTGLRLNNAITAACLSSAP